MAKGKHIKKELLAYVMDQGFSGVTWKDITEKFDIHHGSASSRLSLLHKEGTLARLTERRDGCKIYVYPEFVGDRPLDVFAGRAGTPDWAKAQEREPMSDVQVLIAQVCDEVRDLLLLKNARYGNSALDPRRVFSKASPTEQLLVRIDDELSRIATTGFSAADEDTLADLLGYLVLLKVHLRMENA